jgi:hypothetical protein
MNFTGQFVGPYRDDRETLEPFAVRDHRQVLNRSALQKPSAKLQNFAVSPLWRLPERKPLWGRSGEVR